MSVLLNFIVTTPTPPLQQPAMLKALMLLFDPANTWEKIRIAQHSVGRLSLSFVLPLLLLSAVVEAAGLRRFGVERGNFIEKIVPVSEALALRYEVVQMLLSLVILYGGSALLKPIGASFHRRHTYLECFTTLAYSLAPLFLARMLSPLPVMNTWVCFGIGIFLAVSLLYRGIPVIMKPDPSSAIGLFVFCAFLLIGSTALAHFVADLVLRGKILVL